MINNQDLITPSSCLKQHTINFFCGLSLVLFLCNLTACTPPTEQERIDAVNQKIAPEGYLTKTHLYINWSAYTVGDEVKDIAEVQPETFKRPSEYYERVLLEPLKLKIPIEYILPYHVYGSLPKNKIDRFSMGAFLIVDYKILDVSLSMDKHAKTAKPIFYNYGDPADPVKIKLSEQIHGIGISNFQFRRNLTRDFLNERTNLESSNYGRYIREADVDGLERYVELECYNIIENVVDRPHYLGILSMKASDDKSPENCISKRERQVLLPPPEITNFENSIVITCSAGCSAHYNFHGRDVSLIIFKENRFNWYEYYKHEEYEKELLKGIKKPYYGVQQPLLNEVDTDLPNWREKVAPILPLLESFVRPQSEVFPSLSNPNANL